MTRCILSARQWRDTGSLSSQPTRFVLKIGNGIRLADANIETAGDQDYDERWCYRLLRGGMLSRKLWSDSAPGICGLYAQLWGDCACLARQFHAQDRQLGFGNAQVGTEVDLKGVNKAIILDELRLILTQSARKTK